MFGIKFKYQISVGATGVGGGSPLSVNNSDSDRTVSGKTPSNNTSGTVATVKSNPDNWLNQDCILERAKALPDYYAATSAVSSFGANVVALIYDTLQQLTKDNREVELRLGLQKADLIEEQAEKMKSEAVLKMVGTIVSSAITIVGCAAGIKFCGLDAKENPVSQMGSALGQAAGAIFEYFASTYAVDQKTLEADEQRLSAFLEHLKSITENLEQHAKEILRIYEDMTKAESETNKKILA